MSSEDVLNFWFEELGEKDWFSKSAKRDALIRRRFLKTYWAVVAGECADWRKSARGRLAEIIVLDQFARNMFRGKAQAFLYDPLALALTQEAIRAGADKKVSKQARLFFYMPFMHSESKKIQRAAVQIFKEHGDKKVLWFAREHKKIVDRFGRFPHRNAALGRKSTAAEKAFLKTHKGF